MPSSKTTTAEDSCRHFYSQHIHLIHFADSNLRATDLVIDINGYYAPPTGFLSGWGGDAVVGYQQGNSFPTDPNGILMASEPTGGYNGWQASKAQLAGKKPS